MNRHTFPRFAHVIVFVALASLNIGAGKPVHPPTGGSTAPIFLAVLADGYSANDKDEFEFDVENFITRGLLADPYFKSKSGDFRIDSYFNPTPSGQESIFDFTIGAGAGNCAVIDTEFTAGKLAAAVGNDNPTHFIVLGNYPYAIGCTKNTWTYIAVDAVGSDVLQHEMGHILGNLYDEWSMGINDGQSYPNTLPLTDYRNCGTKPPGFGWSPYLSPTDDLEGCDLYKNGVYRAYSNCRMGTHSRTFCTVCLKRMEWSIAYKYNPGINPNIYLYPPPMSSHQPATDPRFRVMNAAFVQQPAQPQPSTAKPVLEEIDIWRVLIEFDPTDGKRRLDTKHRVFARGVYVPNYQRVGKYVYEVSDGSQILEVGVIPDHMFEARGYRGGAPHGDRTLPSAQFVVAVPRVNQQNAQGKSFSVSMYELPADVTMPIIDKKVFAAVKDKYQLKPLINTKLN